MKRIQSNNNAWLQFDLLSNIPNLIHGVFLRQGGESLPPYESLNVGMAVGDHCDRVTSNRNCIARSLGLDRCVFLKQVHGIHIVFDLHSPGEGDALATRQKRVGLGIQHADCQAAIFYDPNNHAIANVHCGWKGNVQNIYAHTVMWMQKQFKTDPRDLLVCISPSLGPDAAEFIHYKTELPNSFWPFQRKPNYFDLWEISRWQLESLGISSEHIEIAQICTYNQSQDFFSYRRNKITGRNATVIALL